jgi:hypothetical protein
MARSASLPIGAFPQKRGCNYRKGYRYLTIGLWDQVTAVFAESVGPSDRGRWDQVTVDKWHFPYDLRFPPAWAAFRNATG